MTGDDRNYQVLQSQTRDKKVVWWKDGDSYVTIVQKKFKFVLTETKLRAYVLGIGEAPSVPFGGFSKFDNKVTGLWEAVNDSKSN